MKGYTYQELVDSAARLLAERRELGTSSPTESIAAEMLRYIQQYGPRTASGGIPPLPDLAAQSGSSVDVILVSLQFQETWAHYSMPTFDLSHGLLDLLLMTDCDNVPIVDLRHPFRSYVIRLPSPCPISIYEPYDGTVREISMIHVHNYRQLRRFPDGRKVENMMIAAGQDPMDFATSAMSTIGDILTADAERPDLVGDCMYLRYQGRGIVGIDRIVNNWTENTIGSLLKGNYNDDDNSGNKALRQTRLDKDTARSAFRLMVNLTLYLQTIKSPKKRRGLPVYEVEAYLGKRRAYPAIWFIGKKIRLHRGMRECAEAVASEESNRHNYKIKIRFVVRGHWRQQACGPGRRERRRIWIKPYWKGPDTVSQAVRIFSAE